MENDEANIHDLPTLKLLPGKALRMQAKKEHALGLHNVPTGPPMGDVIRCQCGYSGEEGVMVHEELDIFIDDLC